CHRGVAHFRLAGELCLLQVGHTDQIATPGSIKLRFRFGRKSGSLYTNVSASAVYRHAVQSFSGLFEGVCNLRTNRVRKPNVSSQSIAKKSRFRLSSSGAIYELIGYSNVERLETFVE